MRTIAVKFLLLIVVLAGCTSMPAQTQSSRPTAATAPEVSPATTFPVLPTPTTCAWHTVVAGTAGSKGQPLAGCDGTVGNPSAPKVVLAAVEQPVYLQLGDGQGPIMFRVSPASNARVNGLKITPVRAGNITVTVTGGLFCAFVAAIDRQPTSCTLMVISAADH